MSTERMHLLLEPAAPARGTALRERLARAGIVVWRWAETYGRLRAERTLLELADRWQATQPDLAQQLRAACRVAPHR